MPAGKAGSVCELAVTIPSALCHPHEQERLCVSPHVTEPTAQWAWEGPAGDSAPRSSEVGPRSPRETMQPGEERRKKRGTPSYADPSSLPGHGGLGRGKELAVQGHAGPGHGRILHVVFRLYQRRDVCEETTALNFQVRNNACQAKQPAPTQVRVIGTGGAESQSSPGTPHTQSPART